MKTTRLIQLSSTCVILALLCGCGRETSDVEVTASEQRIEQAESEVVEGPRYQPPEIAVEDKRPVEVPRSGADARSPGGGSGLFWLPADSQSGNALVVLPMECKGRIGRCIIEEKRDDRLQEVDEGYEREDEEVGMPRRAVVVFNRPGSSYPSPCFITVELDDGDLLTWRIDDPRQMAGDLSDVVAARSGFLADDLMAGGEEVEWEVDVESLDIRRPGDGFMWVPGGTESDQLTVHLPEQISYDVEKAEVAILGPRGWMPVEAGRKARGYSDASIFVFEKPGAFYPDHCHLVVTLSDGSEVAWAIEGTARAHP